MQGSRGWCPPLPDGVVFLQKPVPSLCPATPMGSPRRANAYPPQLPISPPFPKNPAQADRGRPMKMTGKAAIKAHTAIST